MSPRPSPTRAARAPSSETGAEVALWFVDPRRVHRAWLMRLPEYERAATAEFVSEALRSEHRATRALIRAALDSRRARGFEAWRFDREPHGKPRAVPGDGLVFNATNTPAMVAVAHAEGALVDRVGVDAEPHTSAPAIHETSPVTFSEEERAELDALAPHARDARAVDLWTHKEAYIKAVGLGVSLPLRSITLRFSESGVSIAFGSDIEDDPRRWRFWSTDARGHRIAIAAKIRPDDAFRVTVRHATDLESPPIDR
jgi:4'-phosphopantetheinyl transferase